MTNLSANLVNSARIKPDGAALRSAGHTITYSVLEDHVARLASYLVDAGVRPGDRIAMMLPGSPAFTIVYFAVLHAGAVAVPMNALHEAREVEFVLNDTHADALFFGPSVAPAAVAAAAATGVRSLEVDDQRVVALTREYARLPGPTHQFDGATAVILHTPDGGVLKSTRLSHHNLVHYDEVAASDLLRLSSDDVVMGSCAPLSETLGMTCALIAAISSAATLVLLPGYDPHRALDLIATESVTVLPASLPVLLELLSAADQFGCDTRSLKYCVAGSDVSAEVRQRIVATFKCVVLETRADAASCCAT